MRITNELSRTLYNWQYSVRQWLVARPYTLRTQPLATVPREPERVLLVIAGLLGDSVMTTPVLLEARRLWPHAHLALLGYRHNCELLAACPLLDDCKATAGRPFTFRSRDEVTALHEWLRRQHFDVALLALGDRFASVVADAGIPVRVGVRGTLQQPCLTHAFEIGSAVAWGPYERLNALRCLGYHVRNVPPQLWVSESARRSTQTTLAQLGQAEGEPYVVLHPFGSTQRQWWPMEYAAAVVRELRSVGYGVIIVGGPETRGGVPSWMAQDVLDTTGRFSIPELLAVIEGAALVVSTDSGPFHIGGALGRPLLGLFRGRRPEHAGRYAQAITVFGQDPDCARRCGWQNCQSQPCRQMQNLAPDAVITCARDLLSTAAEPLPS